jgi:hypothetical protein
MATSVFLRTMTLKYLKADVTKERVLERPYRINAPSNVPMSIEDTMDTDTIATNILTHYFFNICFTMTWRHAVASL